MNFSTPPAKPAAPVLVARADPNYVAPAPLRNDPSEPRWAYPQSIPVGGSSSSVARPTQTSAPVTKAPSVPSTPSAPYQAPYQAPAQPFSSANRYVFTPSTLPQRRNDSTLLIVGGIVGVGLLAYFMLR